MKRIVLFLALSLFLVVVSAVGILIYKHVNRERLFYDQAFDQLREGGGALPMITIDFETGGSASVINEHACCSGAGFDAVAIRISDGQEFTASNNYCGLEEFHLEMNEGIIASKETFITFLKEKGFRK